MIIKKGNFFYTSLFILAIALLLTNYACDKKTRYNLSTPINLINSIPKVGQKPIDQNPVPTFYTKRSSVYIIEFDKSAIDARASFSSFTKEVKSRIPEVVIEESESRIVLGSDTPIQPKSRKKTYQKGTATVTVSKNIDFQRTRSFDWNVTPYKETMKGIKKGDYRIVDTLDDTDGNTVILCKFRGKDVRFSAVKERGQYKLLLKKGEIAQLRAFTRFNKKITSLYNKYVVELNDKSLSAFDLYRKVDYWNDEVTGAIIELNKHESFSGADTGFSSNTKIPSSLGADEIGSENDPITVYTGGKKINAIECKIDGIKFIADKQLRLSSFFARFFRAVEVKGDRLVVVDFNGTLYGLRIQSGTNCRLKLDNSFGDRGIMKIDRYIRYLSKLGSRYIIASTHRRTYFTRGGQVEFECNLGGYVSMDAEGQWDIVHSGDSVRSLEVTNRSCVTNEWKYGSPNSSDIEKATVGNIYSSAIVDKMLILGARSAKKPYAI